MISVDYSYKDYKATRFSASSSAYFNDVNTNIKNELKGASTIKIGGEYRFNRLSLEEVINIKKALTRKQIQKEI